jgi:hypothetical protein
MWKKKKGSQRGKSQSSANFEEGLNFEEVCIKPW